MTKRSYSLAELAEHINVSKSPGDTEIDGIASLRDAQPNQISFYANSKQRDFLATTRAGAVLIKPEDRHLCKQPALLCENPYLAFCTTHSSIRNRQSFADQYDPSDCRYCNRRTDRARCFYRIRCRNRKALYLSR